MEGIDYNHNGIDIGNRGGDNLGAHQIDVATVPTDPGESIVPTGPNEIISLEEAEREQERDVAQINLVLADLELQREVRSLCKDAPYFQKLAYECGLDDTGEDLDRAFRISPSQETAKALKQAFSLYLELEARLDGVAYLEYRLTAIAEKLARKAFLPVEYAPIEGVCAGLIGYAKEYKEYLDELGKDTNDYP
jgi:hypothetical protein